MTRQPSQSTAGTVRSWTSARVALVLVPLLLVACATPSEMGSESGPAPTAVLRPANIHHLVFVGLEDPADAAAIIADSDELLAQIPSVTYYFCGPHHDIGRSGIDAAYDIALGVGFDDDDGYRTYLEHPDHVEFVRRWRPRAKWLRIHDVLDATR